MIYVNFGYALFLVEVSSLKISSRLLLPDCKETIFRLCCKESSISCFRKRSGLVVSKVQVSPSALGLPTIPLSDSIRDFSGACPKLTFTYCPFLPVMQLANAVIGHQLALIDDDYPVA